MNISPTQDYLKSLFKYKDGELFWKVAKQKIKIGNKAGGLKGDGRYYTKINGKLYQNSRLIFLYYYGWLPKKVDHIDNNKLNNRLENLRPATSSQNSHNAKKRIDSTSGCKNVTWHKTAKKWQVRVCIDYKRIHLGCFDDLELADLVAQEARNKYHGNFARHE